MGPLNAWAMVRALRLGRLPADLPLDLLVGILLPLGIALLGGGLALLAPRWKGRRWLSPSGAALGAMAAIVGLGWLSASPGLALPIAALLLAWLLGGSLAARWSWGPVGLIVLTAGLCLARLPPGPNLLEPPEQPAAGPDLVLLTLDTFRADHLGAIGGWDPPTGTPALDALAARGALYTRGVAVAPLTLPSHTAMLTGQLPLESGVVRNGDLLPESAVPVSVALHEAGYRTAAFLSSTVLRADHGLSQGFEIYDDHVDLLDRLREGSVGRGLFRLGLQMSSQRPGDRTLARALAWWNATPGPRFLWIHLYDPHWPYAAPAPFAGAHDPEAPDARGGAEDKRQMANEQRARRQMWRIPPSSLGIRVAAYADEISWTDSLAGRLVEALGDGVRMVVAADHGESLVEHGYPLNHGRYVYEPSTRVPVIVVAPGRIAPGTVREEPVSGARVAPTLLALAELGPQAGALLGEPEEVAQTLDEAILTHSPGQQARRDMELEHLWRVSLRMGEQKWIVDSQGREERYDLAEDPGERSPLDFGAEDEAVKERGAAVLEELQALGVRQREERTPEVEEALRALGYVE